MPEGAVPSRLAALRSRKHEKTVAPAEATLAMRHAVFRCNLADRGQGAVCPGGFRLWPQEGYWNHGEVRLRFEAYNVVAPPTTCFNPVVHRTRPRCVVAVRQLWSVVEVVESQTAIPTTERLAITGAAMHTQVRLAAPLSQIGVMGTARCMQVRTAACALADTSGKERSALSATKAPKTSCTSRATFRCAGVT
jgi:hypothetical protein